MSSTAVATGAAPSDGQSANHWRSTDSTRKDKPATPSSNICRSGGLSSPSFEVSRTSVLPSSRYPRPPLSASISRRSSDSVTESGSACAKSRLKTVKARSTAARCSNRPSVRSRTCRTASSMVKPASPTSENSARATSISTSVIPAAPSRAALVIPRTHRSALSPLRRR